MAVRVKVLGSASVAEAEVRTMPQPCSPTFVEVKDEDKVEATYHLRFHIRRVAAVSLLLLPPHPCRP